ncbi:MAG: sulfatase, partial [Myxococcota bacterium]
MLLGLLGCAAPPPDILLVTLDTTRADALGVYGAAPSPTPRLDALAAEGRVFAEAQTVTPLTLPAHASILTGLLPPRHGLRRNGAERLPDEVRTVAERLAEGGYATGAFVSSVILDRSFGLDQGFATYAGQFAPSDGPTVPQHPGSVATDAYARWLLGQRDDAPFFAWVHYYDPHLPNEARGNGFADPYLSEVAAMDAYVGDLLAVTRAMGRSRGLAVVVVGDHGEGRGDHGEATHGWFVYRSTTRVPLVVAGPGVASGTVETPVSVVDVAATVLGFAGLPTEGLDGRDLRGEVPERVVYGETYTPRQALGFAELRFAQDARWRYILGPRPERYDWRADPDEARDLGGAGPEAAALRAAIEAMPGGAVVAPAGADLSEQLAALGYTDGSALIGAEVPFDALP